MASINDSFKIGLESGQRIKNEDKEEQPVLPSEEKEPEAAPAGEETPAVDVSKEEEPEEEARKTKDNIIGMKKYIFENSDNISAEVLINDINDLDQYLLTQKEIGKGKLLNTIGEIKNSPDGKRFFVDDSVCYLPAKGEAVFVGDIHGDSESIISIVEQTKFIERMGKEDFYLVFLGDYMDRGKKDIATMEAVMKLKMAYPENVVLLRGNHEESDANAYYGLLVSLIEKYGNEKGVEIHKKYNEMTKNMPGVVVTANGIIGTHGGVPSQDISSLRDLNNEEVLEHMRWNDPSESISERERNPRDFRKTDKPYTLFGSSSFERFIKKIGAKVMVRGHEQTGMERNTKNFNNKLITIFSTGAKSESTGYKGVERPYFVTVKLDKEANDWNDSDFAVFSDVEYISLNISNSDLEMTPEKIQELINEAKGLTDEYGTEEQKLEEEFMTEGGERLKKLKEEKEKIKEMESELKRVSDRWVKEIKNPNAVRREKRGEFEELTGKAELILSKLKNKTKNLDEAKSEMVEILTRMNSLIDEIVDEEADREGKDVLQKIPVKERQGVFRGIANAGYRIKEYKARLFAGVLNSGAELVLGGDGRKLKSARKFNTERLLELRKDYIHKLGEEEGERAFKEELEKNRALREIREDDIKEKEDAKFYKFLRNFGKVYEKEATMAEKRRTQARMGALQKISGIGALSGNILRSGRMAYDFYKLSSNVFNVFNPFRYFTAAALFTGRALEATKETRFSNTEIKSRTRIGKDKYDKIYSGDEFEQNDEDYQKAYYEAWRIHGEAEKAKEEELGAKGIDPQTATAKEKELKISDLENASGKFIHLDLLKRLGNGREVYRNTLMEMIRQTTEEMSKETKEEKREELQARINALTNLNEIPNLNLDNFKNNPNLKILTKEEQLILSDFLKGDEIYASNGMSAVKKIIAAGIRERVKFIAGHLRTIALDEKLTPRQKRMKQEFYYKTFESFLKDMDRMVDQTGAVDALSYTFRTGEKIAKTASVLMIFDTIYRMKLHFLPGEHHIENGLPPEAGEKEKGGGLIEGLKKRFLGEKETSSKHETLPEKLPEETPALSGEEQSILEELDKEILKDLDDEILGDKKEEKHGSRFLEMISPTSLYAAEPFKTFKDAFDGLKGEERENFKKIYLDLRDKNFIIDKTGKKISIVDKIYADNGKGEKGKEAVKSEIFRIMKEKGQLSKETQDTLPLSTTGTGIEPPKAPKITGEPWTYEKANSKMDKWIEAWKEEGETDSDSAKIYTMFNVPENREIALKILQGKYKYNEGIGYNALDQWIKDKKNNFSPFIYESKPEIVPVPEAIPSPQGTVRPATPPVPESSSSMEGTKAVPPPSKASPGPSGVIPPPPSSPAETIQTASPETSAQIKVEIKEGGYVWNSAFGLMVKGKISADQFIEAWNNSKSGAVVDGKFIRIKDINLVHKNDELVFIPAKGGESARFEMKDFEGDKYKMGHRDMLEKPQSPKEISAGLTEAEKRFGVKQEAGALRDDRVEFSNPGNVFGKEEGALSAVVEKEKTIDFSAYKEYFSKQGEEGGVFSEKDVKEIADTLGYDINNLDASKNLPEDLVGKIASNPEIFKDEKGGWLRDRLKFATSNTEMPIEKLEDVFSFQDIVNKNLNKDFSPDEIYRRFYGDDVRISADEGGVSILKGGERFYMNGSGDITLLRANGQTINSPLIPDTVIQKNIDLNEFTVSDLEKISEGIREKYGQEIAIYEDFDNSRKVLTKNLDDTQLKGVLTSKFSDVLSKDWPKKFGGNIFTGKENSAANVREFLNTQVEYLRGKKIGDINLEVDLGKMDVGEFLSKYSSDLVERVNKI